MKKFWKNIKVKEIFINLFHLPLGQTFDLNRNHLEHSYLFFSFFTKQYETAFSLYNQEEMSKSYSRSNSSKEK